MPSILTIIRKIWRRFSGPKTKNKIVNYKDGGLLNFIDIGSIGGLPDPWRMNADKIKFLLKFEPQEKAKSEKNILSLNYALWERNELRPFYIYKGFNQSGSSLFKQNYEYVKSNFEALKLNGPSELANTWFERSQLVEIQQMECYSLDYLLAERKIYRPFHFIKIDAQGAEFQILKGAEKTLKDCIGLHLELFTIPLYQGIALLNDVSEFLQQHGFTLVKKFAAHGSFNSQNDCLFLRLDSQNKKALSVIRKIYGIS